MNSLLKVTDPSLMIHSFNKYLLYTCPVEFTVLGTGKRALNWFSKNVYVLPEAKTLAQIPIF